MTASLQGWLQNEPSNRLKTERHSVYPFWGGLALSVKKMAKTCSIQHAFDPVLLCLFRRFQHFVLCFNDLAKLVYYVDKTLPLRHLRQNSLHFFDGGLFAGQKNLVGLQRLVGVPLSFGDLCVRDQQADAPADDRDGTSRDQAGGSGPALRPFPCPFPGRAWP